MKINEYQIILNPEWFEDKKYSLSYKHVICYSIHNTYIYWYHQDECVKFLRAGLEAVRQSTPYSMLHFLEIFPFIMNSKQSGLLVVDRTKGCSPLVLYPADSKVDHGDRIPAFTLAFENVVAEISNLESSLFNKQAYPNIKNSIDNILKI
jgi:hypothetical protein